MATASGGEQIVNAFALVKASSASNLSYTAPAGRYAKILFNTFEGDPYFFSGITFTPTSKDEIIVHS